jgi:glycosyltransferase involved in cell wall biosynthesis/spore maturation protein CgeB
VDSLLRWRVLLLDTKLSNPNHHICLAIEKALASDPRVEFVRRTSLGKALDEANKNKCNLFFAFDGEELHASICARLRLICGQAILWITEDPYELPVNLKNADLFDLTFTNDSASVGAYSGRTFHLPFAGSPWLHEHAVRKAEDCRYDLLFVGTAWPNRVELLRSLMDGIKNLSTKIALPSNPHLPSVNLNLPKSAINWRTSNLDFARLANQSKVVLTLHRDFTNSIDTPSIAATPGPRLFEVALAGTCQLVDGGLPEVTKYFTPGNEIELFDGKQEALDRLRELLSNPQKRNMMAHEAQARALLEHTYSHRISFVLDQLKISPRLHPQTIDITCKPRLLLLSHNVIGEGAWGGVEVYIDWIRRTLSKDFEIWTYVPRFGTRGRSTVLRNHLGKVVESFSFKNELHESTLVCSEREIVFAKLLQKYDFRGLHVHHLIGHPPSLPLIAKSLGFATMVSLHDYYAACHHYTLVGDTGRYCEIETRNEADCDFCLGATLGALPGAIARRRGWWRRVLGSFDIIHANTEGLRQRFEKVYGNLTKHSGWSVMGVPIDHASEVDFEFDNGPLRIAVPGNFTRFKGGATLLNVFSQLKDTALEVTLLGRIDDEFKNLLLKGGLGNIRSIGDYLPDQLHNELVGHHVSLHVSMWPETWCLTLSESWRAGIIPIVTNIGALGERVNDGQNGFVIPLDHPSQLVTLLRNLARDRTILKTMRKNVSKTDIHYSDEHNQWLSQHYKNMVAKSVVPKLNHDIQGITASQAGYLTEKVYWFESVGRGVETSFMSLKGLPISPLVLKGIRFIRRNGFRAAFFRSKNVLKSKFNV